MQVSEWTHSDGRTNAPLPNHIEEGTDSNSHLHQLQHQNEFELVPEAEVKEKTFVYPFAEPVAVPVRTIQLLPTDSQACINGFINLRNGSFFNVTMQALLNLPGLTEYFLAFLDLKEMAKQKHEDDLMGRLSELIQIYHSCNDYILHPTKLAKLIASEGKYNPDVLESDIGGFLEYMLERVSETFDR